ncbi:8-amino-7-oxononanoate synthase (plasmid) [Rhizobium gallicum bv. gallicum R602sp]|uniref:8-amino-7-oxononanoate synthase n=1 Tax=Rhizobium gallicum bv. gallicum R602sp TaxID=1041138 RepID=A0A0B4XEJ3_9HYPH|nr:8-amino-7-oxononanoate synthase [Rhizobium gallicum]AJD45506.1 8-amino-7-oxononanoate synthase [Rhizobium gallicum bv. gallicum R602sp]
MRFAGLARYERTLAGLERKGRARALIGQSGIDFTSNDYLGLAQSERLKNAIAEAIGRGVAVGAGGSRLLRGNHPEHEALEEQAATYFGTERVVYFGSGYAANFAVFSTLPQREDIIIHDALIHASAHEGIAASKARAMSVAHNDVGAFDEAIKRWRRSGGTGRAWIAVESLYSMDGDRAPLAQLASIANAHDAFLVVDEAHATGVFGPGGRGFSAGLEVQDNLIVLHTCGKALGVAGALLSASAVICDYLVNRARGFIYSTAPSPLMAAAVGEALRVLGDEPQRRAELDKLRAFANSALAAATGAKGSGSQILPVMIGDNARAVAIAAHMRDQGFDIRAIRPPTVPEGTARLRIAITLNVNSSMISSMFEQLAAVLADQERS